MKLGRKGGIIAFSVREQSLGRYGDALAALRQKGIWKSVATFTVEDLRRATSPHVVLFEQVIDDPLSRFPEVERFFYRLPSPH